MKTRLFFAALLLLAFGTVKAQDTVTAAPKQQDPAIIMRNMPDMSQLPELLRELGVNLQMLTDSVDWKSFEKDMEKWGEEMEEWGRKMEQWGEEFEKRYDMPDNYHPAKKDDTPVRVIRVRGSGDVVISQTPGHFSLKKEGEIVSDYHAESEMLLLASSDDYEVEVSQLENIQLLSSADVVSKGTIKGDYINVYNSGSGDMVLKLDYDTIHVVLNGSGDIILQGRCNVLETILLGSGDLNVDGLNIVKSNIEEASSSKGGKSKGSRSRKKDLLFDAHWNGFEAGLNMLIDPSEMNVYTGPNESMAIRPMRSWYFGFNIADVGVAFDRKHKVGMFTGIGLGWNNYSWKNYIRMTVQDGELVNTLIPDDRPVKNSKFGLLYLQAPLMVEVRPARHLYIDLGVTGGIRLAAWNRIKYSDGENNKTYSNYLTNLFKCDASLRVGGDNLGFFVNYALVPTFVKGRDAAKAHPLMLGFSVNF